MHNITSLLHKQPIIIFYWSHFIKIMKEFYSSDNYTTVVYWDSKIK